MRWRYLILGVLLAGPTAAVVHLWPQMPVYSIVGNGDCKLLGEDADKRQLVFLRIEKRSLLRLGIERRDAGTGRLVATNSLALYYEAGWTSMPRRFEVSDDASTLACVATPTATASPNAANLVAIFDTNTGLRRCPDFTYVQDHANEISPNGRWFAALRIAPVRLVVIDTCNGQAAFEVASPTGASAALHTCYSPDCKRLLYQWCTPTGPPVWPAHLVNLETGKEDRAFDLPADRSICEWRAGELRTFEALPMYVDFLPTRRYRYPFDGEKLGAGNPDSLLDCDCMVLDSPNGRADTTEWVSQWECKPARQAEVPPIVAKIESLINYTLIDRAKLPWYSGRLRIVDRQTGAVRFERDIPSVQTSRLFDHGRRLIVDSHNPLAPRSGQPNVLKVYRTDGWLRWIWSTLAVGGLLAAMAMLGRWRYVVIRRRGQAPPLAATRA